MSGKKVLNRSLLSESADWHNRVDVMRVSKLKPEKRYRTRSLFQADLL